MYKSLPARNTPLSEEGFIGAEPYFNTLDLNTLRLPGEKCVSNVLKTRTQIPEVRAPR